MIERRDFLRGLVLSLTTSGLIIPTASEALVFGDRYSRLVTSLKDLLASNEFYKRYRDLHPYDLHAGETPLSPLAELRKAVWDQHRAVFDQRCVVVMSILDSEFDDITPFRVDPDGTRQRISEIIGARKVTFDVMNENELRRHEDIFVGISVMLFMLARHHMPINVLSGESGDLFRKFTNRYLPMYSF